MKIRFVGDKKRTNSFGTFEPGKLYDVPEVTGKMLLTVPTLFINPDVPLPGNAANGIVEVTEEVVKDDKYAKMTDGELRAECRKRGVMLNKGTRKTEMIQKLLEMDSNQQ
jgi:hypothetical protein